MTRDRAADMSGLLMGTHIKESSFWVRQTARESSHGRMGRCTMESGSAESKKDMGYGAAKMETHILVSGRAARLMDMACMSGAMEIDTKVSGEHVFVMEMALTSSPITINILASTVMGTLMALASTNGQMEIPMQVNSLTE